MSWIVDAQRILQTETGQGCDAGHERHNRKVVPVHAEGFKDNMTIFKAVKYRNTHGYCPGDDDVSRTLTLYGIWEPIETSFFIEALQSSNGLVIDFGTQLGWYSMLSTAYGHDVLAVEGVAEHEEMTRINCAGRTGSLYQTQHWLNERTPTLSAENCPHVCIVKIDVEGAEQHALRCISELLEADLIDNVLMEVSPVFNDSYPPLVERLLRLNFEATALNPVQPVTLDNFETVIADTPQVDMMFTKVR